MLSVNTCHEPANLCVKQLTDIKKNPNPKIHWTVLEESEISVKVARCLTLAAPHSYCVAGVRCTRAFPVTVLHGRVDRREAFWKLQGKPVLEAIAGTCLRNC